MSELAHMALDGVARLLTAVWGVFLYVMTTVHPKAFPLSFDSHSKTNCSNKNATFNLITFFPTLDVVTMR